MVAGEGALAEEPAGDDGPARIAKGIVTTSPSPSPELLSRARAVSERTGWREVLRRNGTVSRQRRDRGVDLAYVVRRDGERVESADAALWVHPGLLPLKRRDGVAHPLIRAIDVGRPSPRILDASLGLCGDALHLAEVLGADIVGCEASPVVACLAVAGVARMAAEERWWSEAASRIAVVAKDASRFMAEEASDSFDVVYIDPMFETLPSGEKVFGEPHGYGLFRQVALATALDSTTLAAAIRVARCRVVLKLPGAAPPPAVINALDPARLSRVRGRAVDYAVVDAR